MQTEKAKAGDRARELFLSGMNCAEAVLKASMEELGIDDRLIPAVASGFGGGVGRTGHLCGALSGAVMASGIRYGTGSPENDKERAYAIAGSLVRSFSSEFGAVNCGELIELDLSKPEDMKKARESAVFENKCASFVEFCANEIVDKLGA